MAAEKSSERPREAVEFVADETHFRVHNPAAHALLQETHWTAGLHGYFRFRGTQAQLIAAGLATPEMFDRVGKSGVRTAYTEFHSHYTIRRLAGGQWDLVHRPGEREHGEDRRGNLTGRAWTEAKPVIEAQVSAILARFVEVPRV